MKLLHTGAAAAAVALLALSTQAAHAASSTTVTVTPETLNGWFVDPAAPPYAFVAGPASIGEGSLQFTAIPAGPPTSKMFVTHNENIAVADFTGVAFDYYVDPAATNQTAQQFYLNVYVDTPVATTQSFYDCRYDYVATTAKDGWNTLEVSPATPAVVTAKNGTCAPTLGDLAAGTIFRIALNAGDTSASDAGIRGGFDKVVVGGATTTVYDFEPAPVTPCRVLPTPGRVGTAGNDVVLGTSAAERIDLRAGNDVTDAVGGDDCILGGDGNDVLRGGAGADEIAGGAGTDTIDGGAGADIVDPGAGKDTVVTGDGDDTITARDGAVDTIDCGPGTDTVIADPADVLRNCETVTRAA
jgi:RTX calcium-binding nonapeptide repeat (4 copies)